MIAVIGEKPSVARDIARILGASEKQDGYFSGNGYLVTWAFGHLVGLAMPEAYGIQSFRRESLYAGSLRHTEFPPGKSAYYPG